MYNVIVGGLINRGEYSTFSPIPTNLAGAEVLSMNKICKVENCNSKHFGLDFCQRHYVRYKRHGDSSRLRYDREVELHGMTKTPEYRSWYHIKDRCYNSKNIGFQHYGGRGITVCERWKNSFINFLEDMGKKPFPKAQIDRKENDKGYYKDNCRWITQLENIRNKSTTKLSMEKARNIRIEKEYHTSKYLADKYSVSKSTINRIISNLSWKESE